MTVLDTSLVVDFLLGSGEADAVERVLGEEGTALAPDILVFEVLAVLRRAVARDALPSGRARGAVEDLAELDVDLFPSLVLSGRAWELRENLTIADGLFVALAEATGQVLMTKDAGMAAAARRHTGVDVRAL